MMHKALADLFESLISCEPETLQAQPVKAVLLALGSNHDAQIHLPRVRERLTSIGAITLSTAFQNPDFTATIELPKPDYTNQCVHILLMSPMTLQQLQQIFKQFECDCNRQRLTETQAPIKKVTMDIDILLVKLDKDNSLSKNNDSEWIIMANRYPFKAHERAGIKELVAGIDS
ncbi:2-amino-4-hydroxy-6-hydroxymethyldihydropteridine diphosphokinase [Psychrobacter cryohalolentis]|uniref:2-amino-4-hydroxy-6- hydroxymethyldihydropteridine diphosphokinase n=1 Tax=Psychrobacter sp. D2 TaxID=2759702 RepID=UPI0015E61794|nr:2-amino-4-hydroxy-6-hydroxymethyldihydropteridine diphosphokinase [Psychrobacter sp. D2]MBA2058116.1 2-amino-4-hydroxy-6-hydroxymethyldihydropteridine diphosphokinase [Psychrobacter sp. D2]